MNNQSLEHRLNEILRDDQLLTDLPSRERFSKDFYWYSPVLKENLDSKLADYIVFPENEEEIKIILSLAVEHRIPVTVRGTGTGNYGQIVPMEGGILIDVTRMKEIIELKQGSIRVEPGIRLGTLERKLREENQELCIYPSTYMKSTAGGFVCGGSGGIGSITWGNLWDGNVIEAKVVTMEHIPRVLKIEGEDLINYIHSYGTTGVVTEIVFRTAPRVDWMECIASFNDLENSLRFAKDVAKDKIIKKRSVSTCEWPVPSYFLPIKKVIRDQEHIVFLEVNENAYQTVQSLVHQYGGKITYTIPSSKYHKLQSLCNYTWNHTTLWALKSDKKMTYLQASFDLDNYLEQMKRIKEKFENEFYMHFDWFRDSGKLIPQSIPLVRYTDKKRLYEMISFCESIGVKIFNPHTVLLEEGGWEKHVDSVLRKKKENDPYGLLNPGKIGVTLAT